jgi:Tfp pilus assembly protein PilN
MIRINLLPPEITQKRKDEQSWKYVLAGAMVVLVLFAVFYMVVAVMVSARKADVAAMKQEADLAQGQTARFQIFQQKEADLQTRKAIYLNAKQGRVDWAQLCNEIALVLPTDIYLDKLSGQEPDGSGVITLEGKAVHLTQEDSEAGSGFKAVAKMLVRLNELSRIDTVWLTSVDHSHSTVPPYLDVWTATTKITREATPTAGAPPAPPAAP